MLFQLFKKSRCAHLFEIVLLLLLTEACLTNSKIPEDAFFSSPSKIGLQSTLIRFLMTIVCTTGLRVLLPMLYFSHRFIETKTDFETVNEVRKKAHLS